MFAVPAQIRTDRSPGESAVFLFLFLFVVQKTQNSKYGKHWPGPALGGPPKYRFYVTRVPGPSVCIYNVPNGRTLAPDTGFVQNKQRFATSSRLWPPASLQSAKSAAGAPWAVRGSHLARLVSLPPLCICCTARLPHINTVDEQRLAALRLDQSKVSCLFVVFCGGSPTPV